jgi:hypothetical protein
MTAVSKFACFEQIRSSKFELDCKFIKNTFSESKMATRGRKQKACFLKSNLGEMLEIYLPGKTTKKRQNSDTSMPPART